MNSNTTVMADAERILRNYLEMDLFEIHSDYTLELMVRWLMARIENTYVEGGTLIDIGGGYSVTNAVLSDLGMKTYCVDLMSEYFIHSLAKDEKREQFKFLEDRGVIFINHDVLSYDFSSFENGSVDSICSYHCFEHLHHSPRKLVIKAKDVLRTNGVFFLELPNAVNLLKRFKVLFGKTNYVSYGQFFESDQFVGHIREYTADDLAQLAKRMGLDNFQIFGLNYYGTLYSRLGHGRFAQFCDSILRFQPGFCSSLFLKAVKQG